MCEYCEEDSEGYVKPLDKNAHVAVFDKPKGKMLDIDWYGHKMEIKINFCPMCRKKGKRVNIYDYEFFLRSVYKRFFRTFCVKLCFMDNNVYYDHTSRHFNVAHTDIGNYSMENRFMEGGQVMTEEEKEAIKELRSLLEKQNEKEIVTQNLFENILRAIILIEKQQEEIEKKDKTIDKMAKWIFDKDYVENSLLIHRDDYYSNCIKQVIEYFEKKEG